MAPYATRAELASYLQQDVDNASADLALAGATATFVDAADTAFAPTTATYSTLGAFVSELELPYRYVTAVSAVRLNGNLITGWSLVNGVLYRAAGFGNDYVFPPQLLEVDLTYGKTAVPDDVKLAVLEIAAGVYHNPTGVASESIDDYTVRYNGTPIHPGRPWRDVAASYRGILIA